MKNYINDDLENSIIEQEKNTLLSQKILNLNLTALHTKFISQVYSSNNSINSVQNASKNESSEVLTSNFIKNQGTGNVLIKSDSSKGKNKKTKQYIFNKKQNFTLRDGRIFQMGDISNGRRPVMTQLKNVNAQNFTGKGMLLFPNGKKFQGQWIQGMLIGEARITYPNGDVYFGGTYKYQKHGNGYLYFSKGEKYIGEFSGGDFHGQGILYGKNDQILYEGEWRRGKRRDK